MAGANVAKHFVGRPALGRSLANLFQAAGDLFVPRFLYAIIGPRFQANEESVGQMCTFAFRQCKCALSDLIDGRWHKPRIAL